MYVLVLCNVYYSFIFIYLRFIFCCCHAHAVIFHCTFLCDLFFSRFCFFFVLPHISVLHRLVLSISIDAIHHFPAYHYYAIGLRRIRDNWSLFFFLVSSFFFFYSFNLIKFIDDKFCANQINVVIMEIGRERENENEKKNEE